MVTSIAETAACSEHPSLWLGIDDSWRVEPVGLLLGHRRVAIAVNVSVPDCCAQNRAGPVAWPIMIGTLRQPDNRVNAWTLGIVPRSPGTRVTTGRSTLRSRLSRGWYEDSAPSPFHASHSVGTRQCGSQAAGILPLPFRVTPDRRTRPDLAQLSRALLPGLSCWLLLLPHVQRTIRYRTIAGQLEPRGHPRIRTAWNHRLQGCRAVGRCHRWVSSLGASHHPHASGVCNRGSGDSHRYCRCYSA